jgi:hypothetical protein
MSVGGTWLSVCWSPELSRAVMLNHLSSTNIAVYSSDAITWTAVTTTLTSNTWRCVCWSAELNLFVAVSNAGINGNLMTSSDGITWTTYTVSTNAWCSVCWSPDLGLFVAVSSNGTGNRVMTSSDGINWITRVTPDSTWRSVCWSSELSLFVAVGSSAVMTSPNGITWTSSSPAENNAWLTVAWGPELGIFLGGSHSGTNRIMTSSNGINWTTRILSSEVPQGICWSPEMSRFVVAASDIVVSNIALPASMNTIKAPVSQFMIATSGNIGIGTTNASARLTISGQTCGILVNSTDTSRLMSILDPNMASGTHYITFGRSNDSRNQAELGFNYQGNNNTANSLTFGLFGGERMRIQGNGFVGIGTTTPNYPVHVTATVNRQLTDASGTSTGNYG